MSDIYESVEDKEEETKVKLKPFTLEDAEDEKFCILCEHYRNCPIVKYVNALEMKRNGQKAEAEFGCTLFVEEAE